MQKYLNCHRYIILAVAINSIFLTNISAFCNDLNPIIDLGDKYYNEFNNLSALKQYEKAYNIDTKSCEAIMKVTRAYNDVGEDYKE